MNTAHVTSSIRRRALLGPGATVALALVLALVSASCSGDDTLDPGALGSAAQPQHGHAAVCPSDDGPGYARCHAHVVTDAQGAVQPFATPSGYGPADLRSAYDIPTGGGVFTVAIVDAYDNPNAEKDLGVYRSYYGLSACTTANGCFKKVNQSGAQGHYPRGNTGWGLEIALDLAMVSAACPQCKIVLVEASNNSFVNLGTAVNEAVTLGANAVSNSYGGAEFSGEGVYDTAFYVHNGVSITASSGDGGYGVEFPAAGSHVIAVGGTHLVPVSPGSGRLWAETVWSGSGSGCSAFIAKPPNQTDSGCPRRTVADVSAVADPSTGVAVYDTYGYGGWVKVGGTSVAAPLFAGILAATGNAGFDNSFPYEQAHANPSAFNDVTSGSNGTCGTYLCTAGVGYDGPTGLGTPDGAEL